MDKVSTPFQVGQFTKENLIITISMVQGKSCWLMETSMMVNGTIMKCMDKAYTLGIMIQEYTRAVLGRDSSMEKVS